MNTKEAKRIYNAIIQLKKEVDPEWAKERRLEYLITQLSDLVRTFSGDCVDVISYADRGHKEEWLLMVWRLRDMTWQLKRIRSIIIEHKSIKKGGNDNQISREDIELARQCPIASIIPVDGKSFAYCLWHDDKKTPNMYCKGNYFYCFACGESGDGIKLMMKKDNLSFVEAINRLKGGV